jgi:hypothetical protein
MNGNPIGRVRAAARVFPPPMSVSPRPSQATAAAATGSTMPAMRLRFAEFPAQYRQTALDQADALEQRAFVRQRFTAGYSMSA